MQSKQLKRALMLHYPDDLTPATPDYQARMLRMQAELIRGYLPTMKPADKRRAGDTLEWIHAKLRRS